MSEVQTIVPSPKRVLQRELAEQELRGQLQEAAGVSAPAVERIGRATTPAETFDRWSNPMQSAQIHDLAAALAKAQGAMENAVMNRINPHFKSKYADLASVLDAIRKPLSSNGLSITQAMEIRQGGMILRTMLMHVSGQWLASEYPLPATARPQEMGSAQTYARRYSIAALVCNSADEDDDANAAEASKQKVEASGRVNGNGNGGLISDAQNQQLQARIANLGVDIASFIGLMKVRKIAEIRAKDFNEAVRLLDEYEEYQKPSAGKK